MRLCSYSGGHNRRARIGCGIDCEQRFRNRHVRGMVDFRHRRRWKQFLRDPEWRQPSCVGPRDPSESRRWQFRCRERPTCYRWRGLQPFTTPGGQLTLTFDWFNKTNFAQFGSAIDGSTQSARVDILFNSAAPFDVGAGIADNLMLNEGTLTDRGTTIPWESASFTITGLTAGTYELRFGNGRCCFLPAIRC